jgi:hypothetical protein
MSKVTKIETEHSIITVEAKETDLEFDKRVGIVDATDNGRALARVKDAIGVGRKNNGS